MAALERSSGRSIPGDLALSTFAGRLLSTSSAPLLPALRAALAALGHAVDLQELRGMGVTDLRQHVTRVRNATCNDWIHRCRHEQWIQLMRNLAADAPGHQKAFETRLARSCLSGAR